MQDLLTSANGLSAPTSIDLDLVNGKIYWADDGTNQVRRANLDGSGVQTLVTGIDNPVSIALDVGGNKMYWADKAGGRIGRANLDGSGAVTTFVSTSNGINGLAVDTARGKLFWTEDDNDRIRRVNLDGTGATTVLSTCGCCRIRRGSRSAPRFRAWLIRSRLATPAEPSPSTRRPARSPWPTARC